MGRSVRMIKTLVNSFNPYRIIACYAIFFAVQAEGNVKSTGVEGPIKELLGSIIGGGGGAEKESLVHAFPCDDTTSESVLNHGNVNDVRSSSSQLTLELPLPNVVTDYTGPTEEYDKELSREQENNEFVSKIKEKPFRNIFTDVSILAPTSNNIKNELCRKHSRIFVHQLKKYKLWALQMYDSSAKIPSGILRGNTNQLGDFDQCLSIGIDDSSPIEGKYCLAFVDINATPFSYDEVGSLKKAVYHARSFEFIKSNARDAGHFAPRFTTMNWGFCVPASCSSADAEQTLKDALQDYNETSGISFDVYVDPDMCYVKPEAEQPYSKDTIYTLLFFGAVICITIMATMMDKRTNKLDIKKEGQLHRMVMAFSIHKNIGELTADLPPEGDINCIYGIRAIGTALLYFAHKVIMICLNPYSNRVDFTEISNQWWTTMFRTSVIYTDSFLLLSGVLTSFNLTKEIEQKKQIHWMKKYVARFIRLTPALLALVLFNAYVMEHLGTGPLWNLTMKRNADICKESLWKNILYIQTFFPFQEQCAAHTHHLSLDMQLSLMTPLLVTLLWQWRTLGIAVLLCLNALSAALRYLITLQNQISLVIFHGMSLKQMYQTANLSYGKALHRATPYLVGVGLGHLMHKTGKNVHIPKFAVGAGWILAAYFAYLSMMSPSHMALRNYEYNMHEATLYAAFSPIIWSIALGWLIWACFTGHGGFINKFLCSKSLVMFSRISYSVYLTQFAVFFYYTGSVRGSQEFSLSRAIDIYEMLTCVMVSIVFTLVFDIPMQEIKNILMGGGRRKTDTSQLSAEHSKDIKHKVI